MNSEEFKNQLSESGVEEDSADGIAYRKVFEALSREPEFNLPVNFADKVIKRISADQKESTSNDTLYFTLGIAGFIIAAIVGVVLTGFKPDFGAFKFLAGYPGLVLFGIAFIIFIQWLDKRVVRKNISL
jgi:hypothetical protein